ncbi:MAG: DNA adenine methylase [Spirochaetes bacterium]|nr:MAG: DNA adenine methylase [Spirochaetota bacterium]
MNIPQPIPYQGSKRFLAPLILKFFPLYFDKLIEPFAGSAAISFAAAANNLATSYHLNDLNAPLMHLWNLIINDPFSLIDSYNKIWHDQIGNEKEYYNHIRNRFNNNHHPSDLLFLLARCVKAAIRYNSNGEFNQSPDNRRRGKSPTNMKNEILGASKLLKGKVKITSFDYRNIINDINQNDLVYMDPPYQGVVSKRDTRYSNGVEYNEFVEFLNELNNKNIMYIISYDGKRADTNYGKDLPVFLSLHKILLDAGLSTQATLLGRTERTYESLYLSSRLTEQLNAKYNQIDHFQEDQQLLFA